MYQVILASGSPRRKEILEQCGISFIVQKSDAEEVITKDQPQDAVMELARLKAYDVQKELAMKKTILIAADTIVAYGNSILGKPADSEDACRMIDTIQGHVHSVYTGVTILIHDEAITKELTFYEETKVEILPMDKEEIADYVASGDPFDKAGSYGIQGAFASYVKGIQGDYYNVVGLPISRILLELKSIGIDLKKSCIK
ncbi:MAG: septum formation protein Maf [Clostridium sp.]|nr:septum formation protein Maf [Clostridium sp.]